MNETINMGNEKANSSSYEKTNRCQSSSRTHRKLLIPHLLKIQKTTMKKISHHEVSKNHTVFPYKAFDVSITVTKDLMWIREFVIYIDRF